MCIDALANPSILGSHARQPSTAVLGIALKVTIYDEQHNGHNLVYLMSNLVSGIHVLNHVNMHMNVFFQEIKLKPTTVCHKG